MARAAVIPGVSATTTLPQQRSTRGRPRTAALPDETPANTQKDVKKAEPAKRGRKPGKAVATKNQKKKDDVDDDGDDEEDDDDLSFDMTASTSSTTTTTTTTAAKGRTAGRAPRKAAVKTVAETEDRDSSDDDDDELADFEVPKKKAGRPKAKAATSTTKSQTATTSTATTTAKSARGRPKTVKVNEQEAAPAEKKTRGRKPAAAKQTTDKTIYVATASTVSSLAKSRSLADPAKKKKVTFADLSDSENESSAAEEQQAKTVRGAVGKKSTATKAAGLKAKPVRKTGTATRGRPPKSQAAAKPLSPKKATQLAKGSASSASSGDEDELASEKTIYSLIVQKSPVRSQEPQHTGLSSPVKRIMLPGQTSTPARSTPARPASHQDENSLLSMQPQSAVRDPVFMGSPARRPPPSTSKETIRDTPRRGPLFTNIASASKLTSNSEATTFLQKLSPLKASPKKGGNLAASFMSAASPDKASGTPFNAKLSLLQSPAKRVQSPFIFRKTDNAKLPTVRAEDDVDTEMYDDTFAHNKKSGAAISTHSVADEISDDELAAEATPVKHSNNIDEDDVFVDHPSSVHEEIENEEFADRSDADDDNVQDDVEIIEDFAKHVNTEAADQHVDAETQQPSEAADEDVVMSNDELLDLHEDVENEQPTTELREDIHTDEEINNDENNAEMEEDVANALQGSDEQCESPDENVEVVQSVIDEDAEQPDATNESTEPTEEAAEIPVEVESVDSENIVIYADSEDDEDDEVPEVETPRSNTTLTSARSSIDPRDIVGADEIDENDCRSSSGTPRFVPPAAPSPPTSSPVRLFRMSSYRDNNYDDTYSEYGTSPVSRRQSMFSGRDSSVFPQPQSDAGENAFSSLAAQLSSWKASSPEKTRKHTSERSIFSPVVPRQLATPRQSMTPGNKYSQIQNMRRSLAARHSLANSVTMDRDETDTLGRQTEQDDKAEQAHLLESEQQAESAQPQNTASQPAYERPKTRLSMSITPVRVNRDEFRTVHTVSKVPLKPEGDESPIKYPRKRARSMTLDIQLPIRASPRRLKLVPKSRKSSSPSPSAALPSNNATRSPLGEVQVDQTRDSEKLPAPVTPSKIPTAPAPAPATTPRRTPKANQQFLRGAVVFVDVHTTEGEDASGIFIELLTQMGAKCVKSWSWNPNGRSSQSPGVDGTEPANNNNSKVGITHVVYKDGGVRTLEKVRQAGNLVKCVGVGWVLDCERANKWLDEEQYCVDSTIIPRGGAKRRKSMQPRALSNVNGSLMSSTSSSSSLSSSINNNSHHSSNRRSRLPSDWDDTVQDLRRMSPSNDSNEHASSSSNVPNTPTSLKPRSDSNNTDSDSDYNFNFNFDFSTMSPATPYFLSQNAHLTQQTCPPKQTNQGLFSSYTSSSSSRSGGVNTSESSMSGAGLRAKLEAARRKSLAFKPRFGSPLSRS